VPTKAHVPSVRAKELLRQLITLEINIAEEDKLIGDGGAISQRRDFHIAISVFVSERIRYTISWMQNLIQVT